MSTDFQARQGDVFLRSAGTDIPSGARAVDRQGGRIVLAYGEVTGHAHVVADEAAALLEDPETGRRWLFVADGATTMLPDGTTTAGVSVVHEEHGSIVIPPGAHEVRIQREYRPTAPVRVAD